MALAKSSRRIFETMARKLGTGSSWAVAAAAAENGFCLFLGFWGTIHSRITLGFMTITNNIIQIVA